MSWQETVIGGTLKLDGTLELDQKPDLPPGRVTVVLRRHAAARPAEDWWQFMQRTRQELESSGAQFMTEAEVAEHVDWLRESDPIDDLLRQAGESPRVQERS